MTKTATADEIASFRAEMAETRAVLKAAKNRQDRHIKPRNVIAFNIGRDAIEVVRREAKARGCSMGELMRAAVMIVANSSQSDLMAENALPPRLVTRHKLDHFDDGKTNVAERDKLIASERLHARISAQAELKQAGAATMLDRSPRGAPAAITPGMMGEHASRVLSGGKSSR